MSYTIIDSSEPEQPIWQAPEFTCPECHSTAVSDGQRGWCTNADCDWTDAPVGSAAGSAAVADAQSTEHGIQKSERYEAHGLPETVAVTRADEEREVFLLEIAHKGIDYEMTRDQARALKECLRLALDQHQALDQHH